LRTESDEEAHIPPGADESNSGNSDSLPVQQVPVDPVDPVLASPTKESETQHMVQRDSVLATPTREPQPQHVPQTSQQEDRPRTEPVQTQQPQRTTIPATPRPNQLLAFDDVAVEKPSQNRVDGAVISVRLQSQDFAVVVVQKSKEMVLSPQGLVTVDTEITDNIKRLHTHRESTKHLKQLLERYMKQLAALVEAEASLSQFLQVEGVRSTSVVGATMSSTGHALKTISDHRQTYLKPAVQNMLNNVTLLNDAVLADVHAAESKVEKVRVELDAQRNYLKVLTARGEPPNARKEVNHVRERLEAATKEFERGKKDFVTKVLMAEDHRLRMFNSMLEDYQEMLRAHQEKASNTLQSVIAKQKQDYAAVAEQVTGVCLEAAEFS